MPIKKPSLTDLAFYLVVALVITGFAYWLTEQDQERRDRLALQEQQAHIDLTRMTMPQAVARCRNIWKAWHYDQPPLAVAWQPQRVDWYVLEGVDMGSMRHFGCDGNMVSTGARYERVLGEHVPEGDETRNVLNDRNLFDYLGAMADPRLVGIEVTEHPATRQLVERRWSKPGNAATAKTETSGVLFVGRNAKDIPILFHIPPAALVTAQFATLKAQPNATNWLLQPERVFALLGTQLPRGARIAEIDFDEKTVKVTIVGPIKNFDNKPPA
ncbi:MAG: hypothetical protein ABI583_11000, partial [Betaproteobacteria bacterium]